MHRRSTTAPGTAASGLDRAACLDLLAGQSFGRLIFTRAALPDVLPVAYRLDGETVLIRLANGSAAAAASHDSVVAFEIDDFDSVTGTGWTVTVVGLAHEVVDPDDRLRLAVRDLSAWIHDGRDHLLALAAEKITGHHFTAGAAAS